MQVSCRFSVAVHILSLLGISPSTHCTSVWIADSVGINPVIIRRVLGQLKRMGLVTIRAGSGGTFLAKGLSEINMLDVYRAVDVVEEGRLFHIHGEPNRDCPVGANIQFVLQMLCSRAQEAMEKILAEITLAEFISNLSTQAKLKV